MKDQPQKFIGTKPVVEKVEKGGKEFSIPVGKIILGMTVGAIVVAGLTVAVVSANNEYQSWNRAWNQVQFAKQNPEIVKIVQDRYTAKLKGVQDEFLATSSAQVEAPKE